ncbi:hypothetical protein Tcan_06176 [Toxocara canis]|nr:hypothetical protein Tcan_06176 [Toxocara canis]
MAMELLIGEHLHSRLVLLIWMLFIFNVIPLLAFVAYLFLSGIIIVGCALFAELLTMLFGLAVLMPVLLFCSISAICVSAFIIAVSTFYSTSSSQHFAKLE